MDSGSSLRIEIMKKEIEQRFEDLSSDGQGLTNRIPMDKYSPEYWIPEERIPEYQKWIGSAANLIRLIDQPKGTFVIECEKILNDPDIKTGLPSRVVYKMKGLLDSVHDEWRRGFLRKIEHIFIAEAFDDFLDHASFYHKGNKKIESSILASAVLEDTMKRIARKNGIKNKGKSLEPLIDDLVKVGVFTPVKAKRVKSFAGIRNHALHAEWDEFDIKDVGELITGVRELIDSFL